MVNTAILKKTPKWAWYASAGVGVAAIGIYTFQNRGNPPADASTDQPTVYGDTGTPSPTGGIIVPDINVGDASQSGPSSLDFQGLYLAGISDLLPYFGDILAATSGGPPASTAPGVVTVPRPNTPAPTPAPPPPPPPAPPLPVPHGPAPCPPAYPNRSATGCFKNCGHCAKNSRTGKWYRDHGHCYPNGRRVPMGHEYPGGCP